MPETIGAAILWLAGSSSLAGTTVLSVSTAAIVGTVALTGASILASLALTPRLPSLGSADAQQAVRQPVPSRRRYYGRVKIAGPWAFLANKEGGLRGVLILGDGPLDAIESFWLNDQQVEVNEAGAVRTAPYLFFDTSRVFLFPDLGASDAVAPATLVSEFPDVWTSSHRGRGIARLVLRCDPVGPPRDSPKVYPAGWPVPRVIARSALIRNAAAPTDPAAWSENWADIARHFAVHPDGADLPESMITLEQALWTQARADCAAAVNLKAGGTEARWRASGGYTFDEEARAVWSRILAAADAKIWLTARGGVGVRVGAPRTPSKRIDQDAGILAYQLRTGLGPDEIANVVHAQFTSPAHDYQPTDADPWVDTASVEAYGERVATLPGAWVTSHAQMRRLMKAAYHRANPAVLGTVVTDFRGLGLVGETEAILAVPDFSPTEWPVEIVRYRINLQTQQIAFEVRGFDPATAYAWDAATEEGTAPATAAATSDDAVPVPVGLVAVPTTRTVGGVVVPVFTVSVTTPSAVGLELEIEHRRDGESVWLPLPVADGAFSAETAAVSSGVWEFRARFRRGAVTGDWTATIEATAAAGTAPAAPVTMIATLDGSTVTLEATAANDALHYATQFWRAGADWVGRTTPADNAWRSICWSPERALFVAVAISGTGNRVMTSPDGITWTARTSAADNAWRSVCWSPERALFVAVAASGTGNRVMTSPDGITWTARTSAADNDWFGVAWAPSLGLFAAVAISGTGNRVMTSPDGITWTARTSAADNQWVYVCWSPELALFCAVAITGTGNRVMTSPDGITWTARTSAADNVWRAVCWSPERSLFVAVANTGTGDRVMTSPDGVTWTARTSAADNRWRGVAWAQGLNLFAATAESGTGNRVMTSPDGITWTARPTGTDNEWQHVAWAPSLGIFAAPAVTGTGNRALTSRARATLGTPRVGGPNQTVTLLDLPGAGSWLYWATAQNSLGAASSPAGPDDVTVS